MYIYIYIYIYIHTTYCIYVSQFIQSHKQQIQAHRYAHTYIHGEQLFHWLWRISYCILHPLVILHTTSTFHMAYDIPISYYISHSHDIWHPHFTWHTQFQSLGKAFGGLSDVEQQFRQVNIYYNIYMEELTTYRGVYHNIQGHSDVEQQFRQVNTSNSQNISPIVSLRRTTLGHLLARWRFQKFGSYAYEMPPALRRNSLNWNSFIKLLIWNSVIELKQFKLIIESILALRWVFLFFSSSLFSSSSCTFSSSPSSSLDSEVDENYHAQGWTITVLQHVQNNSHPFAVRKCHSLVANGCEFYRSMVHYCRSIDSVSCLMSHVLSHVSCLKVAWYTIVDRLIGLMRAT